MRLGLSSRASPRRKTELVCCRVCRRGNVGNSERRTILFAVLPETGHYTGTFRLARALRARGHRIVYLGFADFESLVREQGFEFVSFAEALLPHGYMNQFVAFQADSPGFVAHLRRRPADE